MIIHVTQEDIDEGIQRKASKCAIARACKRELRISDVSVSGYIHVGSGRCSKRFYIPLAIADFIQKFDRDRSSVKPINIEIDLEKGNGEEAKLVD